MMIPRKSPNMMSTIGRIPVIAAPTPRPVKPASEIGVSMMRSLPNSSTRPFSTPKVVPASATSSPIRTTVGSRRNSSAIPSRMASPKVSSRIAAAVDVSGIDVLPHLVRIRVRGVDPELHRLIHFGEQLGLDGVECAAVGDAAGHQPLAVQADRILLRHPLLLFRLGPVIRAGDVADVMAVIAVGDELQKRRAAALARALDVLAGGGVDVADVLAVGGLGSDAERLRSLADLAGGRL